MTEKKITKIKDQKVVLTDASEVTLKSLCGKKGLILYAYPRDATPGCTKEACSFRDHLPQIQKAGYNVAGLSADTPQSHQKFTQKQSLNFPLISDPDHKLLQLLGIYGEKNMYGKKVMGIFRTTFILDAELKIIHVFENVKVDGHVEAVIKELP